MIHIDHFYISQKNRKKENTLMQNRNIPKLVFLEKKLLKIRFDGENLFFIVKSFFENTFFNHIENSHRVIQGFLSTNLLLKLLCRKLLKIFQIERRARNFYFWKKKLLEIRLDDEKFSLLF